MPTTMSRNLRGIRNRLYAELQYSLYLCNRGIKFCAKCNLVSCDWRVITFELNDFSIFQIGQIGSSAIR